MQNRQNGFTYEVITHIGTLAHYPTGWTKELNIISWNGANAKFDIRDWSEDHKQLSKGVTLHKEEARELMELLQDRFRGIDAEPRYNSSRGSSNAGGNGAYRQNEDNMSNLSERTPQPVHEKPATEAETLTEAAEQDAQATFSGVAYSESAAEEAAEAIEANVSDSFEEDINF